MSAASVLPVVLSRLEYLLQEGPVKFENELRNSVEPLLSELRVIERFLLSNEKGSSLIKNQRAEDDNHDTDQSSNVIIINNNTDFNKRVIQLAYDIENAVECHAAASVREVRTTSTTTTTISSSSSSSGVVGGDSRIMISIKSLLKSCRRSSTSSSSSSTCVDIHTFNKRIDELKESVFFRDDNGRNTTAELAYTAAAEEEFQGDYIHERSAVIVDGGLDIDSDADAMEEQKETLLPNLLHDQDTPIVLLGMSGVGKTTLARKVFNDPEVVRCFECRAWASVGQEFRARDVLGAILSSISHELSREQIALMDTMMLMEQLYKFQKAGKRCLIVLDDVRSKDAWETLRFAFPKDPRNRIIITTRLPEVASHFNGYKQQVRMWTESESWDLFKKKSGLRDSDINNNQKIQETVCKILNQCQGLPLAIIAFANIFKGKKADDWDAVLQSTQVGANPEARISIFLRLSYDELPLHLKPCLVYLGQFPPGQPIPVDKLYLMWMAEGLIHVSSSSSVVGRLKIAEEYLRYLVGRSLVTMDKGGSAGGTSCRLHNLIRDLCILKGKEEGFLRITDFKNTSASLTTSSHRVAIYMNQDDYVDGEILSSYIPEPKQVRSLLFFGNFKFISFKSRGGLILELFEWTRVLDFDGVVFLAALTKLILKSIDKLLYLRYLGFRGCYLDEDQLTLMSFSNFLYLETLDLRVSTNSSTSKILIIPNVLWKILSLKYLYFPVSFQSDDAPKKLKLAGMTRLQVIENFHAGVCDANDLLQFEHLQILTGTADGNTKDFKTIISVIRGNQNLCQSSLIFKSFDCYSKERRFLLKQLLQCDTIHDLHLEGHIRRLPENLTLTKIGQNFTNMVFDGSEFIDQDRLLQVLGRVQQLRTLVLCNDAVVGKETLIIPGGFIELRSLKMANLQYLENWVLDSKAMPNLSILTIEQCDKLQRLPDEVMERVRLTELKIGSMPKDFENIIREMAREQLKKGNDKLNVTFYDC